MTPATSAPVSAAIATSSQTPLPLSSLEPHSNVIKERLGKLSQKDDAVPMELRKAIPAECFERNALRGLPYITRDVTALSITFWLFHHLVTPQNISSKIARGLLWSLYGFLNGLFGTGLWVMGHECGHQALSRWKVLNDTVGFIVHSALLVPYFSWKISHGKHHKATGHMERDMVFVPRTRSEFAKRVGIATENLTEIAEEAPIYSFITIFARQLLGWPFYPPANRTGVDKKNRRGGGVNHFSPNSPLFKAKDAKWIILSDFGILETLAILYWIGHTFSWSNLAIWYFLPYLWANHWLVAITYLQHTDATLPHYDSKSWTSIRGAAATIDRDLGFVGRHIFHGIAEMHVLHHYVSVIPFYHAGKASEAIIPVMGPHYRSNTKGGPIGFVKALWTNFRLCQWVEPSEGVGEDMQHVLFYRNKNGLGVRPANVPLHT
ncbi:oleate delta-12 desaturase [Melanomma pulvis-pyrius CBS 109.77]|uniref:Oleate delta-12 desaturase n=1 Tax=Melanomma pulvis-pyrius CBS 109.77 TaxID=1314802 RepID=A0A6A6XYA6_9PLEO|nr:oleate delta-12 desaturase [Melanomma pulvis-pyrius CBS 109.77]